MNKSRTLVPYEAERHLRQSDEIMDRLVSAYGPCPLAKRDYLPFHTLTRAIISQQLSARAAGTIERRLFKLVSTFNPHSFLSVPIDTLRTAGLSAAKARYILELAERVADGRLNFDELMDHPDESVIITLTALPGIGRWTAEMFLIFGLRRPDVLALGDAGLRRAAKMLYEDTGESGLLERVSIAWRPYRSVASWYLWKHLDVVV
jgi:DNA-3-methyladenine glycosylase II